MLVTGSNGKTSVKEMLTACFSAKLGQDHVCATQGNLNNHLGLPLSLLSLRDQHQVGVFEIGANHVGEIAHLSPLAQPTTAMITSIGLAHVGEFGGLTAIKRAKAEIFTALPRQAIAVVPILSPDDPLDAWEEWQSALAELQPLVFGRLEQVQDCRGWSQWVALVATSIEQQGDQLVQKVSIASSHWGNAEVMLPLLGQHQAMNLVGVSAVLLSLGLSWRDILAGIAHLSVPKGRLQVSSLMDDCLLIDDSYNANPSSMLAAVQVLAEIAVDQRFLVLGDMAELGNDAVEGHQMVGESARRLGIDRLWTTGRYASEYAQTFGKHTVIAENHEMLAQDLWQAICDVHHQGHSCAVLIKGSRSSQMEKVIALLKDS